MLLEAPSVTSNSDPYFNRSEVSNSDLTALKKYWMPESMAIDYEKAYRFGTLIDAMITEPDKLDYYQFSISGSDYSYTEDEFKKAKLMKRAFDAHPLCKSMLQQSSMQHVMARSMNIEYGSFSFQLNVRCKWDLWMNISNWGGDIKSTVATTQKQFEEACRYFDYDRQRAWYMDIAESDKDVLIGISKVNYKIFTIPIKRGDSFYTSGKNKYRELAFRHWCLFE